MAIVRSPFLAIGSTADWTRESRFFSSKALITPSAVTHAVHLKEPSKNGPGYITWEYGAGSTFFAKKGVAMPYTAY